MVVPELLCPAGSLEKLKTAILYGANAVYLGGQKFGLRQASDNFTYAELEEGVQFAHARGAHVYVVLNSFLHDKDLEELPEFLAYIQSIRVDAVIVSDLGVVKTVSAHTNIPIHLSTQASCLNSYSGKLWKKMGVRRLILGREVSIKEAGKIKKATGLEVELFVHGSMCMAFSGNCVISNFTQGRDSNRGGCAHSCRFEYKIDFKNASQSELNAYFMSSKDLQGIRVLQEFIDAGIDSIKVEGRMKSPLYAGTMAKIYSDALAYYKLHGNFNSERMQYWETELSKVSHRSYSQASLVEKAGDDSIYNERETDDNPFSVAGYVVEVVPGEHLLVEVKKAFNLQHQLEILPFQGHPISFTLDRMTDFFKTEVERSRPSTLVKIPYIEGAQVYNLIRACHS
jgi:U32 family peptidase